MSYWNDNVTFESLLGVVFTEITLVESEAIEFVTDDGRKFVMNHQQDCCESVTIESIVGDLSDLIGSPILLAEVAESDKDPEGYAPEYRESFTWTFYKLATAKGYVDIRWLGESNGYYSESVSFNEQQ